MLKTTDAFLFSSPNLPARRMVRRFFPIVVLLLSLMMTACQEPEKAEPYPESDLVLEKLDVSCTEAWLKISLTQTDSGATTSIPVILTRDGEAIQSFAFTPPETLVVDAGLIPSHSYQYQAQRQSVNDNKIINSSNTITVTTLDTTSHDFTWTIDTLGNYGSIVMDVARINDSDIWVVGMIEEHGVSYNAAHWDGVDWQLIHIQPTGFGFGQINAIFPIAPDDIWMASSIAIHWNGHDFTGYGVAEGWPNDAGVIFSIWGDTSNDIYFVGGLGSLIHYDGAKYNKIMTGTTADLKDTWGMKDSSGSAELYACGFTQLDETVILRINGEYCQRWFSRSYEDYVNLSTSSISGPVESIWIDDPNYLWAITYWGLYQINTVNNQNFTRYPDINAWNGYIKCLRGNGPNDLLFAGLGSAVWHFNGSTIKKGSRLAQGFFSDDLE